MTPADIQRWAKAYRAVQEREREELRLHPTSSAMAIKSALALIALNGRLHGWPPAEDEYSRLERVMHIACWDRLRATLLTR